MLESFASLVIPAFEDPSRFPLDNFSNLDRPSKSSVDCKLSR